MTYRVHELKLAQADIRSIFHWIREKSPQGAEAWLDAYERMIEGLTRFVGHSVAPEDKEAVFKVQQVLFSTKWGSTYRALYTVEGEDVYILRVRGRGQSEVRPEELRAPD